jgi:hypothetical protein
VFVAALAINLPGAAYLIALKDLATAHHSTAANVALILLFNAIMFALAEVPLLGLIFARERTDALVARADDLAVTLLSEALANIAREPADLASVLDRIPGSWERMQLGREQADRGETIGLDEL